jgi:hypothetical protein
MPAVALFLLLTPSSLPEPAPLLTSLGDKAADKRPAAIHRISLPRLSTQQVNGELDGSQCHLGVQQYHRTH